MQLFFFYEFQRPIATVQTVAESDPVIRRVANEYLLPQDYHDYDVR